MDIADELTHRCLNYAAAVQRQGRRLTAGEFSRYASRPKRRTLTQSPAAAATLQGIASALKNIPGSKRQVEGPLPYMVRLGWVRIDWEEEDEEMENSQIEITDLGRAVLSALEEGSAEESLPTTLVLGKGDPIAKARLVGAIAEAGKCALVDPYFTADDLIGIIQRTDTTRVLTGPNDKARLAALAQGWGDLSIPRAFDIRTSDEFHDRFVIPVDGSIMQIGTSLGGVGKRASIAVRMGDDAASKSVRATFEAAWSKAAPLEPQPSELAQPSEEELEEDASAAEDVEANAAKGAEEDGESPK
jgi:hypothetical protein